MTIKVTEKELKDFIEQGIKPVRHFNKLERLLNRDKGTFSGTIMNVLGSAESTVEALVLLWDLAMVEGFIRACDRFGIDAGDVLDKLSARRGDRGDTVIVGIFAKMVLSALEEKEKEAQA